MISSKSRTRSPIGGQSTENVASGGWRSSLRAYIKRPAYTLYLQARQIWTGGTQADFVRASDYLKRALEIDPKFAQAWATLAQVRMDAYLYGEETARYKEVRAEVLESDSEALRLDPGLSDAHLVMARLLNELDWDWHASEIEFKQAIALDPTEFCGAPTCLISCCPDGTLEEAMQYARRPSL